jgi:capsular exopolysaccharide synthesis family protein
MDLQVLGLVPSMSMKGSPSDRGRQVHLQPQSEIAEAYRTLRTAVYFGTPSGRLKTILVTSPSPGDGKSTVASNLSIAMAQAGGRILLLDADCRRPMQQRIFALKSGAGLSTILTGTSTIESAIQPSGVPNLDILPCGPLPTNPAEVMNSLEFSQLLDELGSRYDQIVLDSPPVVPVTDSRILSACCDVTIVVLRAEKSNRRLGKYAVEALRNVGGSILGAVVNDVSRGRGGYGYYYYSEYGYYPARYAQDQETNGNGIGKAKKNGTTGVNGHTPPQEIAQHAETENGKTTMS